MNALQLFLSLIFGVLPIEHTNDRASKVVSYLHMLVVPLIYLVCFGLSRFWLFDLHNVDHCGTLCNLFNTFFDYLALCTYFWQHAYTLRRRKQFFIDFQRSIAFVDSSLHTCRKRLVDYDFKRVSRTHWYYITWLVILLCFAKVMYYDISELFRFFQALFIIRLMISSFPYLASSCLLGQFHYYVAEIAERFCMLNELFEIVNSRIKNTYFAVIDGGSETVERERDLAYKEHVSRDHKAEQDLIAARSDEHNDDVVDDAIDDDDDGFMAGRRATEAVLADLFKIHDKIYALNVLTNGEYGVQIAPHMTVCFIISNLGIFMWSNIYLEVHGESPLLDYIVLLYTHWGLATLVVAVLVLRICYKCHGHLTRSVDIVHKMMVKKPPFMIGNDGCYDKVKAFVLQFIHWDEYFQFNAIGLYTLDFTFLYACLTASTTYLIVLLQFDLHPFLVEDELV